MDDSVPGGVHAEQTSPGPLVRARPGKVWRWSPFRKLTHLILAAVPLAGWLVAHEFALALAGLLLAGSLALEASRRALPGLGRLLWRLLPRVFRPGEERRVLGSTWFTAAMLATLLLFGQDVGGTAVLFLALGDPAAEIAGRRWGRPGRRKTLAGSLGCLTACLLGAWAGVRLGGLPPAVAAAGALVATLAERAAPPPDDNVWMPLLSGLALAGLACLA